EVIVDDQSGRVAKVERAIRPQALALAGFALLTALASLLVVGQALSRQLSLDAVEHTTLRALGMTPRQLLTMALLRVGTIAGSGAFTFNDNLNRLVSTPRLYGWDWDINTGVGFFPLPKDVSHDLLAQPAVDGVAGAQFSSITIGGKDVPAAGIDQLGGAPVFP